MKQVLISLCLFGINCSGINCNARVGDTVYIMPEKRIGIVESLIYGGKPDCTLGVRTAINGRYTFIPVKDSLLIVKDRQEK